MYNQNLKTKVKKIRDIFPRKKLLTSVHKQVKSDFLHIYFHNLIKNYWNCLKLAKITQNIFSNYISKIISVPICKTWYMKYLILEAFFLDHPVSITVQGARRYGDKREKSKVGKSIRHLNKEWRNELVATKGKRGRKSGEIKIFVWAVLLALMERYVQTN